MPKSQIIRIGSTREALSLGSMKCLGREPLDGSHQVRASPYCFVAHSNSEELSTFDSYKKIKDLQKGQFALRLLESYRQG